MLYKLPDILEHFNRESVAGSVIQATGKVEFEDGTESSLEAAGALVVAAPILGS